MESHGFLTSAGIPIANGPVRAALLQPFYLPSKIAIVYSFDHTKKTDTISLGNNRADKTAKYAAQKGLPYSSSTLFLNLPLSVTNIINYQANVPQSSREK